MRNAESKELNIFKNEYIHLNVSSSDKFKCASDDTFGCASMCIVMTHLNVPYNDRFKCATFECVS